MQEALELAEDPSCDYVAGPLEVSPGVFLTLDLDKIANSHTLAPG